MECQKQTGKKIFIGQSTRFFEPVMQQRKQFESGALGELVTLEAHYKSDSRWFLDRSWSRTAGFSWMYNFMIHAVDLAAWYLPDIEEIFGYGVVSPNTKEFGLNIEDTLTFLAKDTSGLYATIEGSYTTPCLNKEIEFPIECTLRGTNGISRGGYSQFALYQKALKKDLPEGRKCYSAGAQSKDFFDEQTFHYDEKHDYYFRFEGESHHAGEFQNYIDYFAEMMLAGRTPLPDLKEGIHTIGIMEAMSRSLQTGKPVRIDAILKEYGLE